MSKNTHGDLSRSRVDNAGSQDDGDALPNLTLVDASDQTTSFQIDALLAEINELRGNFKAQAKKKIMF